MFKLLLAAGAASLALAAPAAAEPGKNKGNGNGQAKQGQMVQKSQTKHGQMVHKGEAKYAKNTRKVYDGHASGNYWGNRSCPPGLAKKNNGCLPPGIAKQSFNVGDRWNGNYGLWSYNQVPLDWRTQYGLDANNRYYYRNGYLYSVDPQTRVVESVIQALIH